MEQIKEQCHRHKDSISLAEIEAKLREHGTLIRAQDTTITGLRHDITQLMCYIGELEGDRTPQPTSESPAERARY